MKRLSLIISGLLMTSTLLPAQKENNIWYFGQNAVLDFNTTPPTASRDYFDSTEGSASISDSGGQLLFYTNGFRIWDRSHDWMPNGTGLAGGLSSTQAALILPLPGSFTKYYLFTTKDKPNGSLSYSVIDMSLNDGFGDIVDGTKNKLLKDQTGEKVAAAVHANGTDYWIITHLVNSNEFLAYLVSSSGLDTTPVISTVGSFHASDAQLGPVKFSQDGSKIGCSAFSSDTFPPVFELFDFNRCTGHLSNALDLNEFIPAQSNVYGIEFSPNGKLLYFSSVNKDLDHYLFQLDLSSHKVITLSESLYFSIYYYGALQLGPDNKIYFAKQVANFLGVIHHPDTTGLACHYEEEGIMLEEYSHSMLGLPNPIPFPHPYFPDCDDLMSEKENLKHHNSNFLKIEPNPVYTQARIHFFLPNRGSTIIRFFDLTGRILYVIQNTYTEGEHFEEINLNKFALLNGVIYCQLVSKGFTTIEKFIKVN